jgi:glycosyltransferase involved in cell wall biosynthesis
MTLRFAADLAAGRSCRCQPHVPASWIEQTGKALMAANSPVRVAVVVSHPIQHYVHLYRALARQNGLILSVMFCSRLGADSYHDHEMQTEIKWAGNLLEGYDHQFLPDGAHIKGTSFREVNNPSVTDALARFGPDVVVQYGYSQLTQLRALAWCRRNGIPSLMIGDSENRRKRSGVRTIARALVLRCLLRQYAGFLTVSDQNRAFYRAFGVPEHRLYRCPFPLDETAYLDARARRAEHRAAIRQRYGIGSDTMLFLTVGKLSGYKRVGDAVAAAAVVRQRGDLPLKPHLIVCGDGAERGALERQAAATGAPVTFAGFINVDALPGFYAASDVLVHASEIENYGHICAESAAIGLPMILSDQVGAIGPTSVARPDVNALIYPCGNRDRLAGAMARLMTDTGLFDRMAAASLLAHADNNLAASIAGMRQAITSTVRPLDHDPVVAGQSDAEA